MEAYVPFGSALRAITERWINRVGEVLVICHGTVARDEKWRIMRR